jgi:hypothetical protein
MILTEREPRAQKGYGRQIPEFDPEMWEKQREEVVRKGNIAKVMISVFFSFTLLILYCGYILVIYLEMFLLLTLQIIRVNVIVFNATFNNISVISWSSDLLVEEIGVPIENHRPVQGIDNGLFGINNQTNLKINYPCIATVEWHSG